MRIEHLALNVNNPAELTEWLCDNLDMRILRQFGNPPNAFFVADSEEHTVLEISMNPLTLPRAFVADDVAGARERLLAAGATSVSDAVKTPGGDELAMVRAPGGLAIQLMKRATPFV